MPETLSCVNSRTEFESIARSYRSRVYRFILASVQQPDDADTLTQECFLKAFTALAHFRNECRMETWLFQIAINLVRDYTRRRPQVRRQSQLLTCGLEDIQNTLATNQCSPETTAIINEEIQAVWRATETLSERQRTVFFLRFVEDMDLLEIAAVTGMKEGTIKAHLFRALRAVREQFKARHADPPDAQADRRLPDWRTHAGSGAASACLRAMSIRS